VLSYGEEISVKKIWTWTLAVLMVNTLLTARVPLAWGEEQEKEWTFLVFLNGDNNLDSYGTADMLEMMQVGSTDQVNILVLRDTRDEDVSSKIFLINKFTKAVVKDYGKNIDMGDWKNLVEFFNFAAENYPAKKYAVDIWNHGAGWKKKTVVTRGISYDDNSGNHITTPQLGEAFRQMRDKIGRPIDLFGMDACLMQGAEVIYEVADSVNVVIGSEETEPGDGWAYEEALKPLVANPQMGAEELGMIIEREYTASFNGGSQGQSNTQGSAVSAPRLVEAVGILNQTLDALKTAMPPNYTQFLIAMDGTQDYSYSDLKDLMHFLARLKERLSDPLLSDMLSQTIAAFENAIIFNATTGEGLEKSTGVSVWIPTDTQFSSKRDQYAQLKWAQDTHWMSLIENMAKPTFPAVRIDEIKAVQEVGDGFITPGSTVKFRLFMRNQSSVLAERIKVSLGSTPGATVLESIVEVPTLGEATVVVDGLSVQINEDAVAGLYPFVFWFDVPGAGVFEQTLMVGIEGPMTIVPAAISTKHDYENATDESWEIKQDGAAFIRVHFAKFSTESRYDFVYLLDQDNNVIQKIDGVRDSFWSNPIPGGYVRVRFVSDGSQTYYGFDIDKVAY